MYIFREDLNQYLAAGTLPLSGATSVGWIDGGHQFPTGNSAQSFVEKLLGILELHGPFCVHASKLRGVEPCPICGAVSFPNVDPLRQRLVGSSTIWIPKIAGGYFVAPSLIAHYVVDHKYLPPEGFIADVEALDTGGEFNAKDEYRRLAESATNVSLAP